MERTSYRARRHHGHEPHKGEEQDHSVADASVGNGQQPSLPFLRASKTVRREPVELVTSDDPEQCQPKELLDATQTAERKCNSLTAIDAGQSVHDKKLGWLRSKTVSRDSFDQFPDLILSREDLPHPSKLRSKSKCGKRRGERVSEENKVSSHLNQMRKRLKTWEDTPASVLQLIQGRRKKVKTEHVTEQTSSASVPGARSSSVPPHLYQSVLPHAETGQVISPDGRDSTKQYVMNAGAPDPIGLMFHGQEDASLSLEILPHPRKLRASANPDKPEVHRPTRQEYRVHDHIAQLKRKLTLGESHPNDATAAAAENVPISQFPTSPIVGAVAPDYPVCYQEPVSKMLPVSNMRLCPWIDQGTQGSFNLYNDNMQAGMWCPGPVTSSSVVESSERAPRKDPTNMKWPIFDLSEIGSKPFADSSSAPLDQASLWQYNTDDDYSSFRYPRSIGLHSHPEEE